jgi:hypothetical protein
MIIPHRNSSIQAGLAMKRPRGDEVVDSLDDITFLLDVIQPSSYCTLPKSIILTAITIQNNYNLWK